MPLPIVDDTYYVRFVWESSTGPRPASHGLYFRDVLGTQNAAALGADVVANCTANMWRLIASVASIRRILVYPLDDVSAPVEPTFTIGVAALSGSGAGDPIPQGAAVVTVKSALRGPAWRNRTYLPFVGESEQASGTLTSSSVTTAQTAWNTFGGAMVTQDWMPTVVAPSGGTPSTRSADYAGYLVRGNLKTQRRRARR